jgi:hypothetical protein
VGSQASASPSPSTDGGYGGAFPASKTPTDTGDDDSVSTTDPRPPERIVVSVDAGGEEPDEASVATPPDAAAGAPDGACTSPLAPGDLTIDELMTESVAGSGDYGEWFEVASGLDCTANLDGLHGECPHGSKVSTFDLTGATWLPPRGTFVVADSNDPAINHRLPGMLVVWLGHPGDVLRSQGSTLTLTFDGAVVDTVTYPSLPPAVGISVAFPSGCDPTLRSDFTHWKKSTSSWFPGFFGTPNAPNTDVECP